MVNGFLHLYSVKSSTWDVINSTIEQTTVRDIHVATDPDTGVIYVLRQSGAPRGNSYSSLLSVDIKTQTVQKLNNTIQGHGYIAWSASHKSLLYIGEASGLVEYRPSSGWSPMTPSNPPQVPRSGACFVPAYGGAKMILF
ncbi:hypothetical protein BGZ65_012863, partial [Modicella reniformis]